MSRTQEKHLIKEDYYRRIYYYTSKTAGRKSGFGESLLNFLSKNHPKYIPSIRYRDDRYYKKKLINDICTGDISFGKRNQIKDEYRKWLAELGCRHKYAITIALRNKNKAPDLITSHGYLKKICKETARKVYGRRAVQKGKTFSFVGVLEHSGKENVHWHGFVDLPEDIRNLKGNKKERYRLKDVFQQQLLKDYPDASVVVEEIFNAVGWATYCTKCMRSYSSSSSDESFEDTLDHFIFF